tara:strand:- start:161 stop:583 length:423 start_codon:yes stop_codon:yes gene_type:complete
MAHPKLTHQDENNIIVIIRSWRRGLTWKKLVSRIESELEIVISRQTLSSYESICTAFQSQKEENRRNEIPENDRGKYENPNDREYDEKIKMLNLEIENLKIRVAKQLAFIEELAVVSKSNPQVMTLLNTTKDRIRRQIKK